MKVGESIEKTFTVQGYYDIVNLHCDKVDVINYYITSRAGKTATYKVIFSGYSAGSGFIDVVIYPNSAASTPIAEQRIFTITVEESSVKPTPTKIPTKAPTPLVIPNTEVQSITTTGSVSDNLYAQKSYTVDYGSQKAIFPYDELVNRLGNPQWTVYYSASGRTQVLNTKTPPASTSSVIIQKMAFKPSKTSTKYSVEVKFNSTLVPTQPVSGSNVSKVSSIVTTGRANDNLYASKTYTVRFENGRKQNMTYSQLVNLCGLPQNIMVYINSRDGKSVYVVGDPTSITGMQVAGVYFKPDKNSTQYTVQVMFKG